MNRNKFKYLIVTAFALSFSHSALAQTCKTAIDPTLPDSDFELLNNNSEVLHKTTGLIWQRCLISQTYNDTDGSCGSNLSSYNWEDALEQADAQSADGWRLPNVKELSSIVERSCYSKSMNTNVFPDQPLGANYWTSTPGNQYSEHVWTVSFIAGGIELQHRDTTASIRLVRDE